MTEFNKRLLKLLRKPVWNVLERSRDRGFSDGLRNHLVHLMLLAEEENSSLQDLKSNFAPFIKLIEYSPTFLFISDNKGEAVYINERFSEYTGLAISASLGSGWLAAVDIRDRQMVQDAWLEAVATGNPFELEFRIKSGYDQHSRWYLTRALPYVDPKGNITKWFGTCTEINTQKKLKEELAQKVLTLSNLVKENQRSKDKLAESEKVFRIVCETSPHLIAKVSNEGKIAYCNGRFQHYTGFSESNKFWQEIVHPEDLDKFERIWKQSMREKTPLDLEVRLRNKQGQFRWHLIRGLPVQETASDWCLTCTDMESQHNLMTALSKAKESAEEASRLKSSFVANISHELKTPLNGVLGMTQLLLAMELPETAREYLSVVAEAGQSLLGVINDVLDFSKIEAGKLELILEPHSLKALLDGTANVVAPQAEGKQLFFLTYLDPFLPEALVLDGQRTKQVLFNLLSNAIKFTEIGGIVLSATMVSEDEKTCTVRFSVMDSGIGISPEIRQRVFEPFVQDTSIEGFKSGTGLGLSISQNLVELMGGTLDIESEPGNGSDFSFTVKLSKVANTAPSTISPLLDMRNLFGRTIILVGRSRHMTERLARYLSNVGLKVRAQTTATPWAQVSCLLEEENTQAQEAYLISMGKIPKQWLRDKSFLECRFKKVIIINDPIMSLDLHRSNHPDCVYLTCPVKFTHLLAALKGVELQAISSGQPAPTDRTGLKPELSSDYGQSKGERLALIADDSPINLRVARLLLMQLGIDADTVASGQEAINLAEQKDYDIIFLDCQMPGMDGFETCKEIRAKQSANGRWTPIIAVTASAFSLVKEKFSKAGMDDFLPKPIISENVVNLLNKWLDDGHFNLPPQPRLAAITVMNEDTTASDIYENQLDLPKLSKNYGPEHVQLLQLFKEQGRDYTKQIKEALQLGDFALAADRAHGFKGVCATVQAQHLQHLLKDLEEELRQGKVGTATILLGSVSANLSSFLEEIEIYLAKTRSRSDQTS